MKLSEILKKLREEKGETQKETAAALNVEYANYNKWENGKSPNYETLCKIADYFNTTTDYLLGRVKVRNPENQVLLSELGISEKAIEFIKSLPQYPAQTEGIYDKRTLLDILDSLLLDLEFINLLGFIGVASSWDSFINKLEGNKTEISNNTIMSSANKKYAQDSFRVILDSIVKQSWDNFKPEI